jgi:hypothetical protein
MFSLNVIQRIDAEDIGAQICQTDSVLVTPAQIVTWSDTDLKDWLESFGYTWNGQDFIIAD